MNQGNRQVVIKPLFRCVPKTQCEPVKVMRLIGESEVQTVNRTAHPVPVCGSPAKKIIAVQVEIVGPTDTVFENKVVKEGVFQVDIVFASCDGLVRHTCLEIPFMTSAHIEGVRPGMHVQNEAIHTEQKTTIVTTSRGGAKCQVFDVMVTATFLIRVTDVAVRNLVECHPTGPCLPYYRQVIPAVRRR